MRIVAIFHAIFVVLLCFYSINDDNLNNNKLTGTSFHSYFLISITTGYFLWDCFVSVYHYKIGGFVFLLHAFTCFLSFVFTYVRYLLIINY